MQCTNCGADIAEGGLFCSQCGTKVEEKREKICIGCGRKLQDSELFCSQCGTKYDIQINNIENVDVVENVSDAFDVEWEVMSKIDDAFIDITNRRYFEDFNLISWPRLSSDKPAGKLTKDAIWEVEARFQDEHPNEEELIVFCFDYDDKIMKTGVYEEGFMFTTKGIRAWYKTMEQHDKWRLIPYESITSVEHNRALLASVMDIKHGNGKKTRIYLTGITGTKEFVDCVQIFLFGQSSSDKKDNKMNANDVSTAIESKSSTMVNDVEKIVQEVCEAANFTSIYGKSSSDLRKLNYSKCEKVEKNFKIPSTLTLYFIFDATLLGSAKNGLVLAGDKLYCKDTFKNRSYEWSEILKMNIIAEDGNVKIGNDFSFIGGGGDAEAVVKIINEIKKRVSI